MRSEALQYRPVSQPSKPWLQRTWRTWAFYLGVPLLFSIYAAANNWHLIDRLGAPEAFLFYAAHALVPWLITGGLTYLTMQALRRWQPRPSIIMLIGSILACLVTIPYTRWLSSGSPFFGVVQPTSTLDDAWRIAVYLTRATMVWLAVNFVFDRFLGYPRYRYTMAVSEGHTPPSSAPDPVANGNGPTAVHPVFMQRMTKSVTLEGLIAIKAEQHYIQVITDNGSELVLYRLSDAVREMPLDYGVQVHRSWWVSRAAVTAVQASGKRVTIVLRNRLEVPVSAPYQALAKTVVGYGMNQAPSR